MPDIPAHRIPPAPPAPERTRAAAHADKARTKAVAALQSVAANQIFDQFAVDAELAIRCWLIRDAADLEVPPLEESIEQLMRRTLRASNAIIKAGLAALKS